MKDNTQEAIPRTEAKPAPKLNAAQGWRITMIVEAHSAEMLEWGMEQAFDMGCAMFIQVEVSHKDDPTTRVKVRTTKLRKPKTASQELS